MVGKPCLSIVPLLLKIVHSPDFRDGLKPVQRRSLWALYKLGLTPDKPHKKAVRIVGEVIGKISPSWRSGSIWNTSTYGWYS